MSTGNARPKNGNRARMPTPDQRKMCTRVAEQIRMRPDMYYQDQWGRLGSSRFASRLGSFTIGKVADYRDLRALRELSEDDANACGSPQCIAG